MNLIITNPEEFEIKKKKIIEAGKESLHILSDFDRTLTNSGFNNEQTPSLISQLRNKDYLTKDYAEKAHALFKKYHPIEVSSEISQEEKNKKMYEWWEAHFKLLVESGLDKETIKKAAKDMIEEKKIRLRQGTDEFLKDLNNNSIPMIIITSSVGDLVQEFLKQQDLLFNNIHIIGNILEFDSKGKFTGIKDKKIFHVFNKNEAELKNLPIYQELLKRKNVILLGDNLGDLSMIKGFPTDNVLTICFLAEGEEENLENYKENFDIILLGDGDMSFVNSLTKEIVK